jgi:hypothetical protein
MMKGHPLFKVRTKDGPLWPTFQCAGIGPGCEHADPGHEPHRSEQDEKPFDIIREGLEKLSGMIYVAQGWQQVLVLPNGGMSSMGGTPTWFRTLSFERRMYPVKLDHQQGRRKSPLYVLSWLGWYPKGVILHQGWQFPHSEEFDSDSLIQCSFEHYAGISEVVHSSLGIEPVSQVKRFIAHGKELYSR